MEKSFGNSSGRTTLHIRLLWFKWHPFYHNDIEPTWKMFQDTKSFKLDIWNGVLFQNLNFPITDDIFVLWSPLSFILMILHRLVFGTHWRPVIKWCSEFSHWDVRKRCLLDSFYSFFFFFFRISTKSRYKTQDNSKQIKFLSDIRYFKKTVTISQEGGDRKGNQI